MSRDYPYKSNGKRKNRGWLRNAQDSQLIEQQRQAAWAQELCRLQAQANALARAQLHAQQQYNAHLAYANELARRALLSENHSQRAGAPTAESTAPR